MSYPHRIRLRGPWDCEPLDRLSGGDVPSPGRMTLPCRWRDGGLPDFAGRVRFRRRFGHPGRIDTFERVWLTCAGIETSADVSLNGHVIARGVEGPFAFEVTPLLQVRNELIAEVTGQAESGGLWGEVALEVRCSAFLEDVRVTPDGASRLRVTGLVVGTASGPLELYVLLNGKTVAYTPIETKPEGRAFDIVSDELTAEQRHRLASHAVRVDLVNIATVWYQWEQPFDFV
jgi:hypothetical protein